MRISPRFTDTDWKALDLRTEAGWQKAVDIFDDRIRGRFIDMIQRFERMPFAGFAVLALDCLLAETLQQFRDGLDESPRRKTEDFFVKFLTTTRFKSFFDGRTPNIFYQQIRCGILHQAEVKGNSRVVVSGRLVRLTDDRKGLIVNRRRFHFELVQYLNGYIAELRDPLNTDARQKFQKKTQEEGMATTMERWRDAVTFPALDAARRARRTPLLYHVIRRARVTELVVDGFCVPDEVAERLSQLYGDYVHWWRAQTTAERRWFPRHGIGMPDFIDYVHLPVLREHADWWIKLLNDAAPLTYNPWGRAMTA